MNLTNTTNANPTPSVPPAETHWRRRIKYTLNVVVASLLAVVIAILINWISFRALRDYRADLTSLRHYSLSAQTRGIVDNIDKTHRLVALLTPGSETADRTLELLEEYARSNKHLSLERIDPATQREQVRRFEQSLYQRFAAKLAPHRKASQQARGALAEAIDRADALIDQIEQCLGDAWLRSEAPKQGGRNAAALIALKLRGFAGWLAELRKTGSSELKRIDDALDGALPDYEAAGSRLAPLLRKTHLNLQQMVDYADLALPAETVKPEQFSLREKLIQLRQMAQPGIEPAEQALIALRATEPVKQYIDLVNGLSAETTIGAVVIVSPDNIAVVNLAGMTRQTPDETRLASGASNEQAAVEFIGEERITGALLRMQMVSNAPRVIMVSTNGRSALAEDQHPLSRYGVVAQRLRALNFDVEAWTPYKVVQGRIVEQPKPKIEPGRDVVWVLTADLTQFPSEDPIHLKNIEPALLHIADRFRQGDSVLAMLRPSEPNTQLQTSPSNFPVLQMAESMGISVDHRVVVFDDRGLAGGDPPHLHVIQRWPDELSVTRALAGLKGGFGWAMPIELTDADYPDVEHYPLVKITGPNLRTDKRLTAYTRQLRGIEFDKTTQKNSFLIAAAAKTDDRRLIVVADPIWAADIMTGVGRFGLPAEQTGARWPANAELFVNSICWLADREQLIAASARTQAIPRIAGIEPGRLQTIKWSISIALPLVILAAGIGVWIVRRK